MKKIIVFLFVPALLFGMRYYAVQRHSYSWLRDFVKQTKERKQVIAALKRYSASNQEQIIASLNEMLKSGDVLWYRALWLADIILLDANQSAVRKLREEFTQYRFRADFSKDAILAQGFSSPAKRKSYKPSQFDFSLANVPLTIPPDTVVWNLRPFNVSSVWKKFGTYGDGVIIAIFDTGLDPWVPDIVGRVHTNLSEAQHFNGEDDDGNGYIDDIWGYNFRDTTSHPYDDKGHGTHVSGTVVGQYGTGIAPRAKIMPLKVLNSNGSGREGDVWAAIEYAVESGAQVGNFSIGWRHSEEPDRETWRTVITNAIDAGLVCVIAAGNEAGTDTTIYDLRTPGDIPEAITVGAVDSMLARASFSSIGPVVWDDFPYPPGLTKPDVVAPGTGVISTVLPGGYESWDGTSMAAPHITAISALMKQLNPEVSHYQIKAILESTAVDLGASGKDNYYGSGFVNLTDALLSVTEMCTVAFYSDVPGTLLVLPQMLCFFGENDTIFIPSDAETLVFYSPGYVPETLLFSGESCTIHFSPDIALERTVRIGVMDFESGEPIDAKLFFETDTIAISGFAEVVLPSLAVPISATAEGYTITSDTITSEQECKFLFLHHCEDFEDSATFSGTVDWEWGIPSVGPASARSGDKLWATALADTYQSSSDSWLITNWFPAESSATLFLWQWFDCEATNWGFWDGGNVSADFGDGWQIIFPIGDYTCWLDDYNVIMPWEPAFSGTLVGNFWHQKQFPLSVPEALCSVRIAFHFSSDDNTTRNGWFIDDFCLAPRVVREPLVRWIHIIADTIIVAAYGVSAQIDLAQIVYQDTTTSPMEQFACDSFIGMVEGEPGDTVRFHIRISDAEGRTTIYPNDTVLTVVIPSDAIKHQPEVLLPNCSIAKTPTGFIIKAIGEKVEVFDALGRKVFSRKITGEEKFFWHPECAGVYFVKVWRSSAAIERKLIFIK